MEDGMVVRAPIELSSEPVGKREPVAKRETLSLVVMTIAVSALLVGATTGTPPSVVGSSGVAAQGAASSLHVTQRPLEEHLDRLLKRWTEQVSFVSSSTERTAHPDFREIVSMGDAVIPLLVERLGRAPDLVLALMEITGEDPAGEETWGDIPKMARAWRTWARSHAS